MELALTLILFALLVTTAIAIVFMRRLFAVVMVSGVFSLLAALLFMMMDAVDVAFTEAAVGAGISTVLMLSTISLTARSEAPTRTDSWVPLFIVLIVGAVLIYGTLDMPQFGDPNAPVLSGVAAGYIERSPEEMNFPNIVTAVLASYRSFDTFGEAVVVFAAGVGVVLLLSGLGRRRCKPSGGK